MTCARVAVLTCAGISSAFAATDYEDILIYEARSAVKNCDYNKWKENDAAYVNAFGRHLPAELSYPNSCNRNGKLYTVGRPREPDKLHSVGTLVRPQPYNWTGFYIGGYGSGNFITLGQEERFKMTNAVTNSFSDSSQAMGFGFSAGYLFAPFNNNIVVGASTYLDILEQVVNHNFAGGFVLGQTTGVVGSVNAQVGLAATPYLLIYGEAGPAFGSLTQKLNFSGPVTSVSQTGIGLNVGGGTAFQPPDWQVAGHPVAVTVGVNHIFLPRMDFDNAGSPGFIYRNRTDITEVRVGLRIPLIADDRAAREYDRKVEQDILRGRR